jgi:hypothetical protein
MEIVPLVAGETPSDAEAAASVEIPQYTVLRILAVWAAAALPLAALAWLVAPALDDEVGWIVDADELSDAGQSLRPRIALRARCALWTCWPSVALQRPLRPRTDVNHLNRAVLDVLRRDEEHCCCA